MPELIVVAIFIVALIVIELWYVRHNQKTISQHTQEFIKSWGPAGALMGFVAGWFVCHFTP